MNLKFGFLVIKLLFCYHNHAEGVWKLCKAERSSVMGPTREEVLNAERCNVFARHYDSDDIDEMFVVPDGPYEQPIYLYS